MQVITTLLTCLCVVLLVLVIIVERRMREVEHRQIYSAQTIIPSATLIISSKWHTLFSIPPSCKHGSVSFSATCTSTKPIDIHITLHGAGPDPITIYTDTNIHTFDLNSIIIQFHVCHTDQWNVLSLRVVTSNPGPHIYMSDIISTLITE
jgi:hypothetical protein